MYPSFTSLSQRERKRQEILREAQHEIDVDKHLKQKYAEAMWAADNEASTISFLNTRTNSSVQTDASIPSSSSSTSMQETSGVFDAEPSGLLSAPADLTPDIERGPDVGRVLRPYQSINTVQQGPSLAPTNDLIQLNFNQESAYMENDESLEQQNLRDYVINLLTLHPELLTAQINPIFTQRTDGKRTKVSKTYFFGRVDGRIYRTNDRKAVSDAEQNRLEQEIDWSSTAKHLIDRLNAMGKRRDDIEKALERLQNVEKKVASRKAFDSLKTNMEKARKAENTNQIKARNAILSILSTNRAALKRIRVVPIGIDGSAMNESYQLDPHTMDLKYNEQVFSRAEANKLVSWEMTMINLLMKAHEAKIDLEIPSGLNIEYSVPKRTVKLMCKRTLAIYGHLDSDQSAIDSITVQFGNFMKVMEGGYSH